MTGIIKVDDLKDAGGNSIISSNGSGTFTYTFNAGSIARAALAADIIDGTKLADDAINSEHYTDGSIDNAHIADNAIDSEHYADGSIDTAHYAAGSVDTTALGADAVTAAKIADDVVNSEHLAAGGIDTEHLGALQVTGAKLNTDVISAQTELASEPADTDEFMVSDAGTLKRIDYSLIKGGGITVADEWRITSLFTGDAEPISSNLEQSDTECQGQMGSAMSHSSGIWTFPSTGFYLVSFQIIFYNATDRYMYAYISATDDNSTYANVADASAFLQDTSGAAQMKTSCQTILDIADTSLCKVKFNVSSNGGTVVGDTRFTSTGFNFLRLGDT
jgi:hypothetical protein